MGTFNQITVAGRLGRDPEMSYTPSGVAVTKFSIAVDRPGKDAQGNKTNKALWLNVVCWRELAERANLLTRKGAEVLVQGRLEVRDYTDRTNQQRTAIEIIASTVQVFGPRPKDAAEEVDLLSGEPSDIPF